MFCNCATLTAVLAFSHMIGLHINVFIIMLAFISEKGLCNRIRCILESKAKNNQIGKTWCYLPKTNRCKQ